MTEADMKEIEANETIEMHLADARRSVEKAMKLADEHGLIFAYQPVASGTYYGKGAVCGDDHDFHGWYEPEQLADAGRWYPEESVWNSSSLYC